jgi:GAF domain-containing protein
MLNNSSRMDVLHKLSLIDSDEEPFFDRLTELASEILGSPISLVSMVTPTHQFFKSSYGLPPELQEQRQTPLSYSFCQYVVMSGEPLIVEDSVKNPLVKDSLAVKELNIRSYLGIPLQDEDGEKLGSFCVMDLKPRKWTEDDIAIIRAFSDVVNTEIEARAQAHYEDRLEEYIGGARPQLDQLTADLKTTQNTAAIIERLAALRMDILLNR